MFLCAWLVPFLPAAKHCIFSLCLMIRQWITDSNHYRSNHSSITSSASTAAPRFQRTRQVYYWSSFLTYDCLSKKPTPSVVPLSHSNMCQRFYIKLIIMSPSLSHENQAALNVCRAACTAEAQTHTDNTCRADFLSREREAELLNTSLPIWEISRNTTLHLITGLTIPNSPQDLETDTCAYSLGEVCYF